MAKKYPVQYQYNVASSAQSEHIKRGGCASKIIWAFVAMFAIAIFGRILAGGGSSSSSGTTSRYTPTPEPVWGVQRATATPTASPTAEPDYSDMPIEEAARILATIHADGSFVLDYVLEVEGGVLIEMTMESYFTAKTAVRDCCKFSLKVARKLFAHQGVKSLAIYYNTPGRDAYGNETMVRAMDIIISRDVAEQINYEYMLSHIYSSTADYLNIVDRYYVHRDLADGVHD